MKHVTYSSSDPFSWSLWDSSEPLAQAFSEVSVKASEAFARVSNQWAEARASLSERIDQVCKDSAVLLSEACDILSIARNSWSAALVISDQPGGLAFNVFGIVGAVFIIFNALRLIYKAASKGMEAKTDEMRALHTFVHLPANVAYLVVGLGMLVLKVSEIAGKALIAGVSVLVLMWSFLTMSVLMFGEAIYSLHITYQLEDILEDKGDSDLSIKMFKVLAENHSGIVNHLVGPDILDFINGIDFENENFIGNKAGLFHLLNRTGKPDELLAKAKIAKLQSLALDDPEKLGLQTSEECVKKINQFDLAKATFKDCQELLGKVEHANYNANTDAWMLLGITFVSIIAASTGIAFTGPVGVAAEALVTVVASLGWMNFDSSKYKKEVKDYFWEHHQNCKKDDKQYGLQGKAIFAAKTAALILTAPLWVIPAFVYHDVLPEIRNKISLLPEEHKENFGQNMFGAV